MTNYDNRKKSEDSNNIENLRIQEILKDTYSQQKSLTDDIDESIKKLNHVVFPENKAGSNLQPQNGHPFLRNLSKSLPYVRHVNNNRSKEEINGK